MKNEKKCPVCGHVMVARETLINKLNTSNVVTDYHMVKMNDLIFYQCPVCGHGAINDVLEEGFYTAFSVALVGTNDEVTNNYRAQKYKPFVEKLSSLANNTESIFEIGSGCGYLLKAAKEKFEYVLGIEPSEKEYAVSQKVAKGCDIINDFFTPALDIKKKFSAFVATMVFEHLPDVLEAMKYSYEILQPGGVGLIQVPNGQRTINQGIYFEVYPQHLHYFTPLSLAKLAAEANFQVLSIEEDVHRNYLEMYVKKNFYAASFLQKEEIDRKKFLEVLEKYQNISIWGASYVSRSCLNLLDADKIRYFFDMSDLKVDNYISGFPKKITMPNHDNVNENDLIIVFANEYIQDVLKVMQRMEYKGAVLCYDDECNLKFYQ